MYIDYNIHIYTTTVARGSVQWTNISQRKIGAFAFTKQTERDSPELHRGMHQNEQRKTEIEMDEDERERGKKRQERLVERKKR